MLVTFPYSLRWPPLHIDQYTEFDPTLTLACPLTCTLLPALRIQLLPLKTHVQPPIMPLPGVCYEGGVIVMPIWNPAAHHAPAMGWNRDGNHDEH